MNSIRIYIDNPRREWFDLFRFPFLGGKFHGTGVFISRRGTESGNRIAPQNRPRSIFRTTLE